MFKRAQALGVRDSCRTVILAWKCSVQPMPRLRRPLDTTSLGSVTSVSESEGSASFLSAACNAIISSLFPRQRLQCCVHLPTFHERASTDLAFLSFSLRSAGSIDGRRQCDLSKILNLQEGIRRKRFTRHGLPLQREGSFNAMTASILDQWDIAEQEGQDPTVWLRSSLQAITATPSLPKFSFDCINYASTS